MYIRIWGKIMCLTCSECGTVFQCSSLNTCLYHPGHTIPTTNGEGKYYCCGQVASGFTSIPTLKV